MTRLRQGWLKRFSLPRRYAAGKPIVQSGATVPSSRPKRKSQPARRVQRRRLEGLGSPEGPPGRRGPAELPEQAPGALPEAPRAILQGTIAKVCAGGWRVVRPQPEALARLFINTAARSAVSLAGVCTSKKFPNGRALARPFFFYDRSSILGTSFDVTTEARRRGDSKRRG